MAQIVIEVPEEVYNSLKVLAGVKGVPFDKFCFTAFVAGLSKTVRKAVKL